MNALFLKFGKTSAKLIVRNIIRDLNIKEAHIVGSKAGHFNANELAELHHVKIIQEGAGDIYFGVYENIDWNKFPPVDVVLMDKLSPHFYNIFAALDKGYAPYNYEDKYSYSEDFINPILSYRFHKYAVNSIYTFDHFEKLRMMNRHIRYWFHYLTKNKIDCVFFTLVPHFGFEYIIYSLCQVLNIKTAMSYYGTPSGFSFVFSNTDDAFTNIKSAYGKLLETTNPSELTLSEPFEREYQSKRDVNIKPWHADLKLLDQFDKHGTFKEEEQSRQKEWKRKTSSGKMQQLKDKIKRRFDIDYLHYTIKYGKKNYWQRLYEYFDTIAEKEVKLSENYIYLPLAYQPELSSMPLGNYFFYQQHIVDMITHYLPDGWYLYIKEHILPSNRMRNIQFYQDLKQNTKVKLVSTSVSSNELVKNSRAVATITGTPGWEGIVNNKPCLLFGTCFFMYAPGVYRIKSNQDCETALSEIKAGKYPTEKEVRLYFKAMQNTAIEAAMEHSTLDYMGYDLENNARIFADEYVRVIKNQANT